MALWILAIAVAPIGVLALLIIIGLIREAIEYKRNWR